MPELPEVETIRRQLGDLVTGHMVVDAWAHPSERFSEATDVVGARLGSVRRRGKYLLVDVERDRGRDEMVVHLGMTGSLRPLDVLDHLPPDDPYVRAAWRYADGGGLVYRDIRRFGRIAVVDPGSYERLPTLASLGPEPFDDTFDAEHVWRAMRGGRRRVKTRLLDQRMVAGVGNIYADEALWRAGINPARRSVTRAEAARLVDAVRQVLAEGIEHGGTTLRDYVGVDGSQGANQHRLQCYGRVGLLCPRCGTVLRKRVIDGRASTYCPSCQPTR